MESEGPGHGRGGRDVDGGIERVKKEVSDTCDEVRSSRLNNNSFFLLRIDTVRLLVTSPPVVSLYLCLSASGFYSLQVNVSV